MPTRVGDPIPGVVLEHIGEIRTDEHGMILTILNGDLDGFVVRQFKVITPHPGEEVTMPEHYHTYREMYVMITGAAVFVLKDNASEKEQTVVLEPGYRLVVSPGVTHGIKIATSSILLRLAGAIYVSPGKNDLTPPG